MTISLTFPNALAMDDAMLQCDVLTTATAVEAIADEWRALAARARRSPVTDYDRFWLWWNTLGQSQKLHVITGRRDGKLVAVLPLVVMRRMKVLRMLTAPGGLSFEYDVLCEDANDVPALWAAARKSSHYDFAKVKGIFPHSPNFTALSAFARQSETIESFFIRSNWANSKDWLTSLSGNARGNFRRCTRRLEEKGKLSYEIYKSGPLPTEVVKSLIGHKVAWCEDRSKHGLFDQPNIAEYLHKWVELTAQQGNLFLAWMQCGDKAIAFNLGLIDQGVLYAYFWTYDPEWAQLSPGNVILVNTISWAIDNGLKGVDFIYTTDSASEKYFKLKYCNEVPNCYEFTFAQSLPGKLLEQVFNIRKAVKKLIKPRAVPVNAKTDAKSDKVDDAKAA